MSDYEEDDAPRLGVSTIVVALTVAVLSVAIIYNTLTQSALPTAVAQRATAKGPAPNQPFLTMAQLKEIYGPAPWSHQIISNPSYMTNFIYAMPAPVPGGHWHSDCDEWWMIREGELEWVFDGLGAHQVKKGDFVCAPLGYLHRIHVIGDVPAIRMPTVLFGHPSVPHLGPEIHGHARRGVPGIP